MYVYRMLRREETITANIWTPGNANQPSAQDKNEQHETAARVDRGDHKRHTAQAQRKRGTGDNGKRLASRDCVAYE